MALLINPAREPEKWLAAFRAELPDVPVVMWPDVDDVAAIEFVAATRHDLSDLRQYPSLRGVLAMGAGVEHFLQGPPLNVPLVRLADPAMADEMAAYVVHWVVHFQKRLDGYLEQQGMSVWQELPYTPANDFVVGILGYGTIGRRIGGALASLGYRINAWSRSGTDDSGVASFTGESCLEEFLMSSDAVVNVLPHTPDTEGLLSASRFQQFKKGALLLNIGRGATVVESDLLAAVDSGRIAKAVLDVVEREPLDRTNPMWAHHNIRITPHVSGFTLVPSAAALIAANIRRIQMGEEPFPVVDRARGY